MITVVQFNRLKAFIAAGVFDDESRAYGKKLEHIARAMLSGEAVVKRIDFGRDFDLEVFIPDSPTWMADFGTHPDGRPYVHAGDIIAKIFCDEEELPDPELYFRSHHSRDRDDLQKYGKYGKRPVWDETGNDYSGSVDGSARGDTLPL